MATRSKMSTSTTRKVTMKRTGLPTGPPNNPPNGGTKETREQYEKRWDDYQKLYQENKDYSSKLDTYNKQLKAHKEDIKAGPKHQTMFGPYRWASKSEVDAYNKRFSANLKPSGQEWVPYTRMQLNKKQSDISSTGELSTLYAHHGYHDKPTMPNKPAQLGRQPYNPEYEPKLAIKKPGSVKSNSEPAQIIQPKLKTNVPVAIEKPKKTKVDKVGGVRLVKENTFRKNRQSGPFKNLRQDVKSKVTGVKITGRASKEERMAAKEANKSTRAARRTFGKEERLAAGYLKNQGVIEGDTKKEMKSNIKSYSNSNKADKKADKLSGSFKERKAEGIYESRKQAVKTAKKAVKYVSRLEKGKIRSFTPEALGRTKEVSAKVQTTTVGKGKNKKTTPVAIVPTKKSTRMQADRYVY